MNRPKVSACLITYNQEDFIRECLEGAISQIGDFDYEIIIGDDCSSDNTKQICLEYSTKYPNLIKYTKRNNNLGMIGNWISTISECSGNYIALCEGDDYWTDPYKLQKQVDFLEANPEYVLCFHKIKILKPKGELVEDFITEVPDNYETQETLVRLGNYIHTPSVVYRNVIKEFPAEFSMSPIADYFLYVLLTEHGKIKYFEEEMAVYREGVGIWSAKSDYFRNLKTAQTYALIVSGLSKSPSTTKILKQRISNFVEMFKNEISPLDLSLLNTCKAVEEEVICTLLKFKDPTVNYLNIDSYTSKQLITIVFKRIKKRLLR